MLMNGKKGIVVGVANKNSIAWGIANALLNQGAKVAFTCQTDKVSAKLKRLLEKSHPTAPIHTCDASQDDQIASVVSKIAKDFGEIDFLVHSIAFAQRDDLDGPYLKTSREGFALSLNVSAYTLTALCKNIAPHMKSGGAVLTLSYLGAEKVVPGYNVMGVSKAALEASVRYLAFDMGGQNIRVNAISAGPVNTLAARGIAHFTDMYKKSAERAPLKAQTTIEEVGDTALYLLSDMSRGVTGEVIHVDKGLHILCQ